MVHLNLLCIRGPFHLLLELSEGLTFLTLSCDFYSTRGSRVLHVGQSRGSRGLKRLSWFGQTCRSEKDSLSMWTYATPLLWQTPGNKMVLILICPVSFYSNTSTFHDNITVANTYPCCWLKGRASGFHWKLKFYITITCLNLTYGIVGSEERRMSVMPERTRRCRWKLNDRGMDNVQSAGQRTFSL